MKNSALHEKAKIDEITELTEQDHCTMLERAVTSNILLAIVHECCIYN